MTINKFGHMALTGYIVVMVGAIGFEVIRRTSGDSALMNLFLGIGALGVIIGVVGLAAFLFPRK